MSEYESIVPEKIETNTFNFHGASIVIDGDYNSYRGYTIEDLSNFFMVTEDGTLQVIVFIIL